MRFFKSFLCKEGLLINVQGITEIGNHHFATSDVIMDR